MNKFNLNAITCFLFVIASNSFASGEASTLAEK